MKDLSELDHYRRRDKAVLAGFGSFGDHTCGAFEIPHPATGVRLQCIASANDGWDHVSVSLKYRCPNWPEMEHVKRTFFKDEEIAVQLHLPVAKHIDIHPYCLHLWRPHAQPIPLPPAAFV